MAKQLLFSTSRPAPISNEGSIGWPTPSRSPIRVQRAGNVVLDKKFGSPTITNDGVTIAKEIELEEPSRTWAPSWSRKWRARRRSFAW